ncbi:MAG: Smr/MutS family protein [Lysobacterales bacterium]
MKSRPAPDAEDIALFQDAVGPVRRIQHERVALRRPAPPPLPTQTRRDAEQVRRELLLPLPESLDPDAAEPLRYLRDGLNPRLLQQIGRGQFSVQDQIDLHQMTGAEARLVIKQFLDQAIDHGRLCVKIVHGKGRHSSPEGPVLKRLTDRLLRQRRDVLAFRSARANDGGSGAVIVLLSRPR